MCIGMFSPPVVRCYGCCWIEGLGRKRGADVLQYPRSYSVHGYCFTNSATAAARVVGALGTPAAGLCPRPAREKGFPSNLLLD